MLPAGVAHVRVNANGASSGTHVHSSEYFISSQTDIAAAGGGAGDWGCCSNGGDGGGGEGGGGDGGLGGAGTQLCGAVGQVAVLKPKHSGSEGKLVHAEWWLEHWYWHRFMPVDVVSSHEWIEVA